MFWKIIKSHGHVFNLTLMCIVPYSSVVRDIGNCCTLITSLYWPKNLAINMTAISDTQFADSMAINQYQTISHTWLPKPQPDVEIDFDLTSKILNSPTWLGSSHTINKYYTWMFWKLWNTLLWIVWRCFHSIAICSFSWQFLTRYIAIATVDNVVV